MAIFGFFACVSCAGSEKVNPDARLPLSQMTILGVTARGSHDDVRAALGEPASTASHNVGDSVVTTWHYPDIEFSFLQDEIYDMQCTGAGCVTGAGVKMGAGRAEVIRAYGPASHGQNPTGTLLQYKDPQGRCSFDFSLSGEKVNRIYVQCSEPWNLIERGG